MPLCNFVVLAKTRRGALCDKCSMGMKSLYWLFGCPPRSGTRRLPTAPRRAMRFPHRASPRLRKRLSILLLGWAVGVWTVIYEGHGRVENIRNNWHSTWQMTILTHQHDEHMRTYPGSGSRGRGYLWFYARLIAWQRASRPAAYLGAPAPLCCGSAPYKSPTALLLSRGWLPLKVVKLRSNRLCPIEPVCATALLAPIEEVGKSVRTRRRI